MEYAADKPLRTLKAGQKRWNKTDPENVLTINSYFKMEIDMKKLIALCLLLCLVIAGFAETRAPGAFYTPEKLKEMSTLVFSGRVLKIETNDNYKVSFPVEAKVDKVVKGKLEEKKLSFKHKHPGRCIIIEKEFNTPRIGEEGTFYIQDQGGTLLLIGYIKNGNMPSKLLEAYNVFVKAMQSGDAGIINKHCLPHAISFTYEKRKNPGYGQDINTHFSKNGFDSAMVTVRKDAEGCFLIRTNTTALWFVETKAAGWKLYKYLGLAE